MDFWDYVGVSFGGSYPPESNQVRPIGRGDLTPPAFQRPEKVAVMAGLSRRRYLKIVGVVGVAGLAGCSAGEGEETTENTATSTTTNTEPVPTETARTGRPEQTSTQSETRTATGSPIPDGVGGAPMFRYDAANTGGIRDGSGPQTGVIPRWQLDARFSTSAFLVVVDGIIYVSANSLLALGAVDGTRQWQYDGTVQESAAVLDGTVYVGGFDYLHAVDTVDGTRRWRAQIGHATAAPTAENDTVYVGSRLPETQGGGDYFRAIDVADGTERWQFDGRRGPFTAPAVADETVYATNRGEWSIDTRLYAFDGSDGTIRWTFTIEDSGRNQATSAPVVADGTVYVCSEASVYALNEADGSERWRFDAPGQYVRMPVIGDGTVYVGGENAIHAVDPSEGTELWRIDDLEPMRYPPVVVGDAIYAGEGRRIRAFDAGSGEELWRFPMRQPLMAPLTVVDGVVFAMLSGGTFYALTEPASA